jgi:tRNA(fMet)-specific endonuclease VapC
VVSYFLDTNICIDLIQRRSPWARVLEQLTALRGARVLLSALTVAELQYGVAKNPKYRPALDTFLVDLEVVPFDSSAAEAYGDVLAALEKKGASIGPIDTLLAAHAKSMNATFVTHNTREFSRVAGLKLADWTLGG